MVNSLFNVSRDPTDPKSILQLKVFIILWYLDKYFLTIYDILTIDNMLQWKLVVGNSDIFTSDEKLHCHANYTYNVIQCFNEIEHVIFKI